MFAANNVVSSCQGEVAPIFTNKKDWFTLGGDTLILVAIATIAGLSLAGVSLPKLGTLGTNILWTLAGGAALMVTIDGITAGIRSTRPTAEAKAKKENVPTKMKSKESKNHILKDIQTKKIPPEMDVVRASRKIPCHLIVNGLYLGSSQAFAPSVGLPLFKNDSQGIPCPLDTSNQAGFNAIVTVCPLLNIDGDYDSLTKYSKEQVGESFSKANITWSYVGRLSGDDKDFWEGLVHDCTCPDSELATKKSSQGIMLAYHKMNWRQFFKKKKKHSSLFQ